MGARHLHSSSTRKAIWFYNSAGKNAGWGWQRAHRGEVSKNGGICGEKTSPDTSQMGQESL